LLASNIEVSLTRATLPAMAVCRFKFDRLCLDGVAERDCLGHAGLHHHLRHELPVARPALVALYVSLAQILCSQRQSPAPLATPLTSRPSVYLSNAHTNARAPPSVPLAPLRPMLRSVSPPARARPSRLAARMPARAPSSARRRRSHAPRQRPCRAAACSRSLPRHSPPCYFPRPPCPIGRRSGFLHVLPRRNAPIFSRLSSRSPTSVGLRLPVSYSVTVTNLDGTSGSLASGLRVVSLFPPARSLNASICHLQFLAASLLGFFPMRNLLA